MTHFSSSVPLRPGLNLQVLTCSSAAASKRAYPLERATSTLTTAPSSPVVLVHPGDSLLSGSQGFLRVDARCARFACRARHRCSGRWWLRTTLPHWCQGHQDGAPAHRTKEGIGSLAADKQHEQRKHRTCDEQRSELDELAQHG